MQRTSLRDGWCCFLCVAGLGVSGCREGAAHTMRAAQEATPTVTKVDSVRLQETESLFIGQAAYLSVDPVDGTLYVADGYAAQAYRFGRDGTPLQTYGRPGGGPGEIEDTRAVFALDGSTVAVDDFRERTLELFDRATGEFTGRVEHGGISGGQVVSNPTAGTVWMAFPDFPGGEFAVTVWQGSDDLGRVGSVPAIFREHPHFFATGGLAPALAPFRDGLLIGFGALDKVYVMGGDGNARDSVRVPRLRRRALAPDVVTIMEGGTEIEKREAISRLLQMTRRGDGSFVLVHADPHLAGEFPAVETWAEYYMTVLSADLSRACVDLPVPLGPRVDARLAVRGDTVFALYHKIVEGSAGEEPYAESWVDLFTVDDSGCPWVPTDGSGDEAEAGSEP